MKKPDIPADEQARIQTLRSIDILDTPSDERFNRLTRMAARLLGVPTALVSLVDEERQWFKSAVGLDASETPRDISFCGHAILGDEIFIIPDAAEDERFYDNPLVTEFPKIRFYAGCPLKAINGHKLGTLCVIDQRPHTFNAGDIEALQDLSAIAESEIAALQLASLDELTGLCNRRGFSAIAQHALFMVSRQHTPACLIYFDLDRLKYINDNLGHAEGDLALTAFADLSRKVFRNSDVFARLGGDEFSILLTSTARQAAELVMARFQQVVEKYNREGGRGYDLEFSYGLVEFNPEVHLSIELLLADADALMYTHKQRRAHSRPA